MKLIKKSQNRHGPLKIIQYFILCHITAVVLAVDKDIIGRSYSLSEFSNPIILNSKLFEFLRENRADIKYKIKNQRDPFPTDQNCVPLVYDPMVVDETFFNSFWQKHSELSDCFKKLNDMYMDLNNQWEQSKIEKKEFLEKYQKLEKDKEQFFKHNSQILKEYYILKQENENLKNKIQQRYDSFTFYLSILLIGGFFNFFFWLLDPVYMAIRNYNFNYCYKE